MVYCYPFCLIHISSQSPDGKKRGEIKKKTEKISFERVKMRREKKVEKESKLNWGKKTSCEKLLLRNNFLFSRNH